MLRPAPYGLDIIRAEMAQQNDVWPIGWSPALGWMQRPVINSGANPHGSAIPVWWNGNRIPDWRVMLAWWVVCERDTGNPVATADVEIGDIELWAMNKAGMWMLLYSGPSSWANAYKNPLAASVADCKVIRGASVLCHPGNGMHVHGGMPKVSVPWNSAGDDISALCAMVAHRVVGDGAGDSQYTIHVGIDYWPTATATIADLAPSTVLPSAAIGKIKQPGVGWSVAGVWCDRPVTP